MTGAHLFPLESLGLEASQHHLKSGNFLFFPGRFIQEKFLEYLMVILKQWQITDKK